jgi:hypothetical protein
MKAFRQEKVTNISGCGIGAPVSGEVRGCAAMVQD